MPVQRREVKRFVSFNLGSESRRERMTEIGNGFAGERIRRKSLAIFAAAENLLETNGQHTRLVFPARGMRPLFDAVRGLNEVWQVLPRRHIQLVNTPKGGSFQVLLKDKHYELIRRGLGRIPKGRAKFTIVDALNSGHTYRAIATAIKQINPDAEVTHIPSTVRSETQKWNPLTHAEADLFHQYRHILPGVEESDEFNHPTWKNKDGKIGAGNQPDHYAEYLYYQQLLQEWLDRKRAELAARK